MVIRQGLEGKALEATWEIDREVMKGSKGGVRVLEVLDRVFRKEKVWETYEKVRKYLKVERQSGEKVTDFIQRYEKISSECKRAGLTILAGETQGCHLLEQANLTDYQRHMVISACGTERLEYEKIASVMKRMFEGLESNEKQEEDWLGQDKRQVGRNHSLAGGSKKNPMRNGVVTKCAICASEYHWARDCPKHFRNRKGDGKNVKSYTSESVYIGEAEEEKDSYWQDVEGILDTGCNSTLCGEL